MDGFVQVKAEVPRDLKRRAFAALAFREEKFSRWLQTQLEAWLAQVEENDAAGAVVTDAHQSMGRPE